ncbi:VWA domain-containing protein [Bernardetia sp. Wsw4-3y2]|uniref:vWA domain-containing protein n=1 Tax=Bernardetia sp. Wsw4-3y2 TaxID=3127471 RepID=UPI0030D02236
MTYSNSLQKFIQQLVVSSFLAICFLFSFITHSYAQDEAPTDSVLTEEVKEEIVLEEHMDIILAIDVSSSMKVEDVTPTRLEAVKSAAQQLMSVHATARYGIVLFAGESMIYARLGDQEVDLYQLLEQITTDLVDGTGTVLGEALDTSIKEFERVGSTDRKIIIFSDGATSESDNIFKRALLLASKRDVEVYAIGVGGGGEAAITTPDQEHITIKSPYNDESLKQISIFTNGKYYHAESFEEMSKIAEEISLLLNSK